MQGKGPPIILSVQCIMICQYNITYILIKLCYDSNFQLHVRITLYK